MTKKTTEPDSFFLSFVGEYVQILTNVQFTGAPSSRGAPKDATLPLIIEGYILDSDDNYTYLSSDGVEIKQAVKNSNIVYVQVMDATDETSELFDSLGGMKKGDMN